MPKLIINFDLVHGRPQVGAQAAVLGADGPHTAYTRCGVYVRTGVVIRLLIVKNGVVVKFETESAIYRRRKHG